MARFFEYEDRGMIRAVRHQLEHGQMQMFCGGTEPSNGGHLGLSRGGAAADPAGFCDAA
jgi:hypothetical protein